MQQPDEVRLVEKSEPDHPGHGEPNELREPQPEYHTGALERANVDITEELVSLIAAQRNFQANAKAIETANSMDQSIINLRS